MRVKTIGIIGGTGRQGGGLALRWAEAGYDVIIGSRDGEKASAAAIALNAMTGSTRIRGASNEVAAQQGDIVVLTVHYAVQQQTALSVLDGLKGKLLIDVTAPIVMPAAGTVQLPEGGSAVAALQAVLGQQVRVVSAFQNISAALLRRLGSPIDGDVLVCGDDQEDVDQVIGLAREAGMDAFHAGPLANSAGPEALAAIMLTLMMRYKRWTIGLRLTDIPDRPK
jgi:NADPH-dependent F420 reductase